MSKLPKKTPVAQATAPVVNQAAVEAALPEKVFLSKLQILGAQDVKTKDIHVPEWGGWLRIKTVTAAERDLYQVRMYNEKTNGKVIEMVSKASASLIKAAVIDPSTGKPMFTDADLVALSQRNADVVERVVTEIRALNLMADDSVEETAKEFAEGQNLDS